MDPEKHSYDPEGDAKIPEPVADAIRNGSLDKKILEHSNDADEAMKAFQGAEGQVIEIDAATNKRLLRKIDWNLMPVYATVKAYSYMCSLLTISARSCALYMASTIWTKQPSLTRP
jgi:ACS family allantoate permease-like MFS transporter